MQVCSRSITVHLLLLFLCCGVWCQITDSDAGLGGGEAGGSGDMDTECFGQQVSQVIKCVSTDNAQ